MTAPMTAAEYRGAFYGSRLPTPFTERVFAALEEREALLAARAVLTDERDRARTEAAEVRRLSESDASVGALVRRIREHAYGLYFKFPGSEATYSLDAFGLSAALDSLLPKEPEVVTGPSGWTYEAPKKDGDLYRQNRHNGAAYYFLRATEETVPPCDYGVVVKLMEGRGNGD